MARTGTKRAPVPKAKEYADIDDGVLDTDSEADEFETYGQRDEGSDDEGEAFDSEEEEQGDGVGQWEPDDWDGEDDMSSESDEESASDSEIAMRKLKKGLNDIPLATLMKAQAAMRGAPVAADRDGDPGPTTERERKLAAAKARLAEIARAKGKGKAVEDSSRGKAGSSDGSDSEDGNGKRSNKHAPTMMSTKKQVSRNRQVVDVPKVDRRDPRFSSLSAGQVDAHLHAKSYSFMPEMLKTELDGLRSAVTAAAKAERTCKLVEKPRFTAERERLERELGRVRTRLERTERENREREVLSAAKREEREKRDQGKGAWYMKKGEKRDLLLKAKYDALESRGKHAVKKAVEKKRKKVAGKEKKSRPFAPGASSSGGRGGAGGRRADGGEQKRRRVA